MGRGEVSLANPDLQGEEAEHPGAFRLEALEAPAQA